MVRKFAWLAAGIGLLAASGLQAQTLEDLKNDASTPGDVLTYGMGYDLKRFSPLKEIDAENVKSLVPVWAYSLADTRGQETFPIIHDGTMYVTTHDATMALDAATGRQKWKTMLEYPAETPRMACCGIVNRGAAIYDGKLFRTTLDANVIALDAKSGEEVWRTNSIDIKDGYSMTVAPLVADGVVIVGISGGEYGTRGYIEGYDPDSGERLWRTYTIPAPGEPGSETWKDEAQDAWKRGGGPTWLTGSYDPELNTVYWGTGNGGPWNAAVRPGDNLYIASVLALDPKSGDIKWHYQFSPNDPFDYDGTNELVLADIDGRKVLMQANRNGFFYVIDRETGKPLAANPFVDGVNWAKKVDLESGRPDWTDVYHDAVAGKEVEVVPSTFGGKNWGPMAYNPETGRAYVNTLVNSMTYKNATPSYRAGTWYIAVELTNHWPDGARGKLRAIDPMSGEVAWEAPADIPRNAGVLTTSGGLVFTGAQTGEFEAFDAESGDKLWQFQTGSGIIGQPVTWEQDGRQYVTVASGGGAVYVLHSGDERLAAVPAGGSIWTFALPQE